MTGIPGHRNPGSIFRTLLPGCSLATFLLVAAPARADISGFVLEDGSKQPIAGARVHLQGDPDSPVVFSAADGSFTLPVSPADLVHVAAGVEYDLNAPVHWNSNTAPAMDGDVGVVITLPVIPAAEDPNYQPPTVNDSCIFCHLRQVDEWQNSVHASATEDFWVRDLYSGDGSPGGSAGYVFLDTHDPGETGFCAACHAPLADAFDPGNVFLNQVTEPGLTEGVSCLGCHQIDGIPGDVNGLHTIGESSYRFPASQTSPTSLFVWGPLDDVSFINSSMRASYAPFFSDPRMCATCHQYLSPVGQTTWEEWTASPYAVPGENFRTCQNCHMPAFEVDTTICEAGDPPERPGAQRHSHAMIGATPETLSAAILLDTTAEEAGGRLVVRAEVTNQGAGHSFPTGVSIRNAFVVISATLGGQPLTQAAGPTLPFWVDDEVPGRQEGDYAGDPGKGFAKILAGRINGQGPTVMPVLFIDAESVFSSTAVPSGTSDLTEVEFALPAELPPGSVVEVSARLLYRRTFRALQVTKGWTETPQGGPIEIEVAADLLQVPVVGGPGETVLEVPAVNAYGLALLVLALGMAAVWLLHRRSSRIG